MKSGDHLAPRIIMKKNVGFDLLDPGTRSNSTV
jgi:hypothetical protein